MHRYVQDGHLTHFGLPKLRNDAKDAFLKLCRKENEEKEETSDTTEWHEMKWHGKAWDGKAWDGMGWDGMGWDGMG